MRDHMDIPEGLSGTAREAPGTSAPTTAAEVEPVGDTARSAQPTDQDGGEAVPDGAASPRRKRTVVAYVREDNDDEMVEVGPHRYVNKKSLKALGDKAREWRTK